MSPLRPLVLVSLLALLVACGQKGPLVLPDAQHPRKKLKLPAPPHAPAAAPAAPAAPATAPGGPTPDAAPPEQQPSATSPGAAAQHG
jgi:predicted small lipoprotein YifL